MKGIRILQHVEREDYHNARLQFHYLNDCRCYHQKLLHRKNVFKIFVFSDWLVLMVIFSNNQDNCHESLIANDELISLIEEDTVSHINFL